jgi:hypothetical protein
MLEQPSLGNGGEVDADVDEDTALDEDISDLGGEFSEDPVSWIMPTVLSIFLFDVVACNVLYQLFK